MRWAINNTCVKTGKDGNKNMKNRAKIKEE